MENQHSDRHAANDVDLRALAWVQDELRRSLEAGHKALRRFVREAAMLVASDVDVVDPSVLRTARQQFHQGVGALDLIGLPAAAQVLRANESLVQRAVSRPKSLQGPVVDAIERASFAVLDYLNRMLAGKGVSPLLLFPHYRTVLELTGAERIHPSELWAGDWRWLDLLPDPVAEPLHADAATHRAMEQQLLAMMREKAGDKLTTASERMSNLCASLSAGATQPQTATLWGLAAAFYEAQYQGLLRPDVFTKRSGSRLLAQLRMLECGEPDVSERLARDLLFFCAQAQVPDASHHAPRLAAVRQAYCLPDTPPPDYTANALGRFDPALVAQARKRVLSAKDDWAAVAGGEMHRLAGLAEQFTLVGDSLKRLYPSGEVLASALLAAVGQTQRSAVAPPAPLAMEVATSLLYLDASLEDSDFDDPQQGERARRLAERIASVRDGGASEPLEAWMEELYRRVSDRQTLGSVVQELRTSLSESEKLIDQFFRNPGNRDVLIPVPAQLSAMRGVLSVLGLDHATHTVLRMRDDVDGLISTEVDPERAARTGTFDRLAGNLGALGFLIDMFSVQPHMTKSLFVFDAEGGTLRPVMGRETTPVSYGAPIAAAPHLIEQAQTLAHSAARDDVFTGEVTRDLSRLQPEAGVADQPALVEAVSSAWAAFDAALSETEVNAAREHRSQALDGFVSSTSGPGRLGPPVPPAAAPEPLEAPLTVELEEDAEMREVFLEEAREVLTDANNALETLTETPSDLEQLTILRRAFHTLKGSSRMVGLRDFGEAAWVCEQVYNSRLAEQRKADPQLLEFSAHALGELGRWVQAIANAQPFDHRLAVALKATADALEMPSTESPSALAALPEETTKRFEFPRDFPAASELDFSKDVDAPVQVAPAEPAAPDEFGKEVRFDESVPFPEVLEGVSFLSDARPEVGGEPSEIVVEPVGEPENVIPSGSAERGLTVEATQAEAPLQPSSYSDDDQIRMIGPLRISIPLFNIYLNEADELSRRLCTRLAEWAMELDRPVGEAAVALAHSLAGSSATVGFDDLSRVSRTLEHALARSQEIGRGDANEAQLFIDTGEEIRRLLHQFAAGFLIRPSPELLARLTKHDAQVTTQMRDSSKAEEQLDKLRTVTESESPQTSAPASIEELPVAVSTEIVEQSPVVEELSAFDLEDFGSEATPDDGDVRESPQSGFGMIDIKPLTDLPVEAVHVLPVSQDEPTPGDGFDAVDAIDAELFPIFEEECQELLPQLGAKLRDWMHRPNDRAAPAGAMRTLHTLKGGARLAGAMRLGELCHQLEGRIEYLVAHPPVQTAELEALLGHSDTLIVMFDALRSSDAQTYAQAAAAAMPTPPTSPVPEPADESELLPLREVALADVQGEAPNAALAEPVADVGETVGSELPEIDWARFPATSESAGPAERTAVSPTSQAVVRVRAPLLDGLINQAGEVSITRTRMEADVGLIKTSLADLTDNLERLRGQLRDLELQGEMQMSSRMEAAKAVAQAFDPLEFDRFTRFQELTRMLAESVNDVATVQRTLQRAVENTEDELVAQMRLLRDLQGDLLRTRMVEFESQADRLYRVVRQAAKETGKQVRLDIVGGSIELDRGVLERMIASFEHLLRNCVTHGIEAPNERSASGKDPVGMVVVALKHEGNEVEVEFRDDGRGLDLEAIRSKGIALGLLAGDARPSEVELANLIFKPGFSTAAAVTELAGRGVGMDVVLSEVNAIGGRIETATAAGRGSNFKLILPLTTAVTQVVMLRCGQDVVAVPSTLVEVVRRATQEELDRAYVNGIFPVDDKNLPFFWLGALLQSSPRSVEGMRAASVAVIRSAQQRVALHLDEVLGNQEVVVKNLGPQLSRLPGLVGVTLLASGAVALIYNPVALATLYGEAAREVMREAARAPQTTGPIPPHATPTAGLHRVLAPPLVLVVDDSLTVRRVTQRLLVREGYRVTVAKDGMDALERLAEEKPQVMLSDIEMPRMDGFDLVRNIRSDARLQDLPVIMITSRIAQKHRDHAAELGVDHYLGKPYSEEDLLALIGRYASREASTPA